MVALQEQAELVQEAEDSGEAERKRQKQAARDADVEAEYNARFEERKAKWKAIQVRVLRSPPSAPLAAAVCVPAVAPLARWSWLTAAIPMENPCCELTRVRYGTRSQKSAKLRRRRGKLRRHWRRQQPPPPPRWQAWLRKAWLVETGERRRGA